KAGLAADACTPPPRRIRCRTGAARVAGERVAGWRAARERRQGCEGEEGGRWRGTADPERRAFRSHVGPPLPSPVGGAAVVGSRRRRSDPWSRSPPTAA